MTYAEERERIAELRKKHPGMPKRPCLPQGKKVIVWRLPLEEKTAGGLYVPEEHANPQPMGILIGAGLKARDSMRDALIEIGDLVWLPRFTTNSPEVERDGSKKGKHVELLNIEDIVGSVDADMRLEAGYDIVFDEEESHQHHYVKREEPGKYVAVNASPKDIASGKVNITRRTA